MGTRSLTYVYDTNFNPKPKPLVCIYRQMDGYPEGMGKDLAYFLKPFTIVNGIGMGEKRKIANGGGCLAAQLVQHLKAKAGVGGIYLTSAEEAKDSGQDFEYRIYTKEATPIRMVVNKNGWNKKTEKPTRGKVLFDGDVKDFDAFLESERAKEAS